MKKIILFTLLLTNYNLHAAHKGGDKWQQTKLSDTGINNIQKAKYKYKDCIRGQIVAISSKNMDTRKATDIVIKQCESELAVVRQVFIGEQVPDHLADRYMKETRTQAARDTLKHLMFVNAAKKMGHSVN